MWKTLFAELYPLTHTWFRCFVSSILKCSLIINTKLVSTEKNQINEQKQEHTFLTEAIPLSKQAYICQRRALRNVHLLSCSNAPPSATLQTNKILKIL